MRVCVCFAWQEQANELAQRGVAAKEIAETWYSTWGDTLRELLQANHAGGALAKTWLAASITAVPSALQLLLAQLSSTPHTSTTFRAHLAALDVGRQLGHCSMC
eukprot:m.320140 g.320140  ORF g.320140 m.320140 type:complete len:104 (+) comp15993_c0_seq2:2324-2635(+)